MRWRAKSWMKDKITGYYGSYVIDDLSGDAGQLTGKERKIWLEIGTGRGQFICRMAEKNPDVLFIGVERATGVIYRAVEKAEALLLSNVRFVNRDVVDVFDWLGTHSVQKVFLNFSDPWPKNKHAKKRLTSPVLLEQYKRLLVVGGKLVLKTDNESFFDWSFEQLAAAGARFECHSRDWHGAAEYPAANDAMTEYEQRFSARGQKIFRLVAEFPEVKCENLAQL